MFRFETKHPHDLVKMHLSVAYRFRTCGVAANSTSSNCNRFFANNPSLDLQSQLGNRRFRKILSILGQNWHLTRSTI
jgi:hypothetical protein